MVWKWSFTTIADHTGMIADFRRDFVVLILTVPIMLLSPMIQHWMNVDWNFGGSNYLVCVNYCICLWRLSF
jgi:hypothetical protein